MSLGSPHRFRQVVISQSDNLSNEMWNSKSFFPFSEKGKSVVPLCFPHNSQGRLENTYYIKCVSKIKCDNYLLYFKM